MARGKPGVPQHHARPSIAHHRPHLFPARALIAMHRALHAGRFLRAELAAIQPDSGIVQQGTTLGAQSLPATVLALAIDPQHGTHGGEFASQSGLGEMHCRGADFGCAGHRGRRSRADRGGRCHATNLAERRSGGFDAGQSTPRFSRPGPPLLTSLEFTSPAQNWNQGLVRISAKHWGSVSRWSMTIHSSLCRRAQMFQESGAK